MKEGKLEIIIGGIFIGGFLLTIGALSKLKGNADPNLYTGLASVGIFNMIASTYTYVFYEKIKGKGKRSGNNNSEVYSQ